jgi:Tol biopolymer transport system component
VVVKKGGYWQIIVAVALVTVLACGCGVLGTIGDPVDHGGSLVNEEGQIAFSRATSFDPAFEADIYTINVDGSGERKVTDSPGLEGIPSWSPDGERIVYTSGAWNDQKISIMNADGSEQRTFHIRGGAGQPAWSPDGERIAFTSDVGPDKETWDNEEIFVMNSDGSGLTRLTDDPAYDAFPAWRPSEKTKEVHHGENG